MFPDEKKTHITQEARPSGKQQSVVDNIKKQKRQKHDPSSLGMVAAVVVVVCAADWGQSSF